MFSSSKVRFLGFVNQSDPNPSSSLEIEEIDVFWAPDLYNNDPDAENERNTIEAMSPSVTPPSYRTRNTFSSRKFGLSALLSGENPQIILQNKVSNLSSSFSSSSKDEQLSRSAPVDIPIWTKGSKDTKKLWRISEVNIMEEEEDEQGGDEESAGEMVPPHVIVARSHVTSFSVFEGAGRTLKGRDLRRVRNAVLRKTGFL